MPHLALLRAVNVGGRSLTMADLKAAAAGLGWGGLRTHLASGNLVFQPPAGEGADLPSLSRALEAPLGALLGAPVPVLVLDAPTFAARLASCPFSPVEGKHVHGMLLFGPVTVDADRLAALRAPSEDLALADGVAWLHTPEGFGRSKLAEKLPTVMRGAPYTGRNLNTLRALAGLLGVG